jgi:hypothetical protein
VLRPRLVGSPRPPIKGIRVSDQIAAFSRRGIEVFPAAADVPTAADQLSS